MFFNCKDHCREIMGMALANMKTSLMSITPTIFQETKMISALMIQRYYRNCFEMVKGQGSNSCVSKTHRFSCVKIVKGVGIYDDISVHLSIFC